MKQISQAGLEQYTFFSRLMLAAVTDECIGKVKMIQHYLEIKTGCGSLKTEWKANNMMADDESEVTGCHFI